MEFRQHQLTDLLHRLFQRPLVAAEMQADVVDPGVTHGAQFLNQSIAAALDAEAMALNRRVGVIGEVEMNKADVGLVTGYVTPEFDSRNVVRRRAGI